MLANTYSVGIATMAYDYVFYVCWYFIVFSHFLLLTIERDWAVNASMRQQDIDYAFDIIKQLCAVQYV